MIGCYCSGIHWLLYMYIYIKRILDKIKPHLLHACIITVHNCSKTLETIRQTKNIFAFKNKTNQNKKETDPNKQNKNLNKKKYQSNANQTDKQRTETFMLSKDYERLWFKSYDDLWMLWIDQKSNVSKKKNHLQIRKKPVYMPSWGTLLFSKL